MTDRLQKRWLQTYSVWKMYSKRNMATVSVRKIWIAVTKNLARLKGICKFLSWAKSAYKHWRKKGGTWGFFYLLCKSDWLVFGNDTRHDYWVRKHCKCIQQTTPVDKNINCLFIYESCGKMALWERQRIYLELLWFTSGWVRYIQSYVSWCFFHRSLIKPASQPRGQAAPAPKMMWLVYFTDWPLVSKFSIIIYFPYTHTFLHTQFTWHFCCPLFTLRHSCTSFFLNFTLTCPSKVNM